MTKIEKKIRNLLNFFYEAKHVQRSLVTISGRWTTGGGAIGWERDVKNKDAAVARNKNPS
jgi:hypothetical protein